MLLDGVPVLVICVFIQVQSTSTFRQEESDFVDSHGVHLMSALPELGELWTVECYPSCFFILA